MSIGVTIVTGDASSSFSYSVQYRDHLMVVTGECPLDDMGRLLKGRRKWYASTYLAFVFEAVMVCGTKTDIERVETTVRQSREANLKSSIAQGCDPYLTWKKYGDGGASASFIANFLSSGGQLTSSGVARPADIGDFGRCERMLEVLPEFRERLGELTQAQGYAGLVQAWPELRSLYLQIKDKPDPKLEKLFQSMLDAALSA